MRLKALSVATSSDFDMSVDKAFRGQNDAVSMCVCVCVTIRHKSRQTDIPTDRQTYGKTDRQDFPPVCSDSIETCRQTDV